MPGKAELAKIVPSDANDTGPLPLVNVPDELNVSVPALNVSPDETPTSTPAPELNMLNDKFFRTGDVAASPFMLVSEIDRVIDPVSTD
jgi:hypothetical protein